MKKLFFGLVPLFLVFLATSCAHTYKDLPHSSYLSFATEPNIRVKVSGRRGGHILEIPLETYLSGVIGHEMSPRWPAEALKAQAIAARSYALYQMQQAHLMGRAYDVVDTQADQVFHVSGTNNAYLRELVAQTRGLTLWKKGRIVQAFYSSNCGGKSETAMGAGLSQLSPLRKSRADSFCAAAPFSNWSVAYSTRELSTRLARYGYNVRNLRALKVKERNPSGYAQTVAFADDNGTHELPAAMFRRLAGNMRVKSLYFDAHTDPTGLIYISGRGFGHGVGLCQYGARGMAERDLNYKKILQFYYPKIELKRLYE